MQSSRNTTEQPTAEQLYAALTRRLKKASTNITQRKLSTGEYVMHEGRVMPVSVVEEAKAEVAKAIPAEKKLHRVSPALGNVRHKGAYRSFGAGHSNVRRSSSVTWVGSKKSATASSVENSIRRPISVLIAAVISNDGSQNVPVDGQLFSYDAKSEQMIPLPIQGKDGLPPVIRRYRSRSQQRTMRNVYHKTK